MLIDGTLNKQPRKAAAMLLANGSRIGAQQGTFSSLTG
jgi:hypothetical protein